MSSLDDVIADCQKQTGLAEATVEKIEERPFLLVVKVPLQVEGHDVDFNMVQSAVVMALQMQGLEIPVLVVPKEFEVEVVRGSEAEDA